MSRAYSIALAANPPSRLALRNFVNTVKTVCVAERTRAIKQLTSCKTVLPQLRFKDEVRPCRAIARDRVNPSFQDPEDLVSLLILLVLRTMRTSWRVISGGRGRKRQRYAIRGAVNMGKGPTPPSMFARAIEKEKTRFRGPDDRVAVDSRLAL